MFSKYIILFVIYSFMGFIWESFFCIFQYKGWSRRGFLYGPVCPIYGVGALVITFLIRYVPFLDVNNPNYNLRVFLVASIGSFILEWCTATFLEKVFNAAWWDYSMFPLNIQGKVCLFCTLGFGVGGIIIPKYVIPVIENYVDMIPNILYEPIAYVLIIIMSVDFALTISALTDFQEKVKFIDTSFNSRMENVVEGAKSKGISAKDKLKEEKEKYIDENIKRIMVTKDYLYNGAIGRINQFKFKDRDNEHKNLIAKKIKTFLRK